MPPWLRTKLHLRREIARALDGHYRKGIVFTGHHESHAASAFYPSPFAEAAVLTVDGVGEWDTATIGRGAGNRIEVLKTQRFPHSLGLLYSALTYFCGFKVNSGEYKLMGLAPHGEPRFARTLLENVIDLKEDGSLALDLSYFDYSAGLRMTAQKMSALLGGTPRQPEAAITQREKDLAASIQQITEEAVLRMARTAQKITGSRHLCLAGGVALNCVANGKLARSGLFEDIYVPPSPGDSGGAVGAALFVHHQLLGQPRAPRKPDIMRGAWLGPAFSDAEIQAALAPLGLPYEKFADESDLLRQVAEAIAAGQVVGWFHGCMEFGPRALGARSILADARDPAMQATLNQRIKFRESFRPFAPAVLAEDAANYFELDRESPTMSHVVAVRPAARTAIPAVTHVDGTARVQTVDAARHGRFYRLLREFKRQTGCAVMINTSFNVRGEPIVCTPADACRCFLATGMDLLVLETCLLRRPAQPAPNTTERQRHLARFALD
jgi:carbamoyltransferase